MKASIQFAVAAGLSLFCVSAIMFLYHDQFWWPVDEGVYAYVAQRANAGDILHRDLIDLHSGYGNALNALAFRMFGEDLLSLRYPLVAVALLQSLIAFILLRKHGAFAAFAGAVSVSAFSFVQFPNPSANWHALGAFFCLCLCLEALIKGSAMRLVMAGLIVGVCFFTRQLSGVFLALGLICVLLSEAPTDKSGPRAPALLIGGISFVGLLTYLGSKHDIFGMLWGGVFPLGLLALTMLRARIRWSFVGRTSALILAGFVISALPLTVSALWQGSFTYWISDILFTALLINGQDFISQASFLTLLQLSAYYVILGGAIIPVVSGVAWICLVLSVPLVGAATIKRFRQEKTLPPVAILAVFWAIGALHYQIPIYLLFVLPAVALGVLSMQPNRAVAIGILSLSGWALAFQAGQPLDRGLHGTVSGERSPENVQSNLPRVSLRIQATDAEQFRELLEAIEAAAKPGEPLMTIPMEPELNFMTGRKSPVRYYGTPLGLRVFSDVEQTIATLDAVAPLVVVHRRQDKYLTPLSQKLLSHVQQRSGPPVVVGLFDLYRYPATEAAAMSKPEQ